jgi:hypothetical protein
LVIIRNGGGSLAVPYCDPEQTSEEWEESMELYCEELGPEWLLLPETEPKDTSQVAVGNSVAVIKRLENQE